jgi:hypothetical protein
VHVCLSAASHFLAVVAQSALACGCCSREHLLLEFFRFEFLPQSNDACLQSFAPANALAGSRFGFLLTRDVRRS